LQSGVAKGTMLRQLGWCSTFVLCCLSPALAQTAAAPPMDVQEAQRVLDAAPRKRAQIAQGEQAQRQACLQKFASSGCLKQAARDAQDQRAWLRQEENAAKRVLRQERVRQQDQRIRERSAKAAPQPAPIEKRAPIAPPATPRPAQKKPPLQGGISAGDIAANEAEHAKRVQEAKAKQAEIQKKVADRAAKRAQKQQQQLGQVPAKP
jgi:colicin import membrane protein